MAELRECPYSCDKGSVTYRNIGNGVLHVEACPNCTRTAPAKGCEAKGEHTCGTSHANAPAKGECYGCKYGQGPHTHASLPAPTPEPAKVTGHPFDDKEAVWLALALISDDLGLDTTRPDGIYPAEPMVIYEAFKSALTEAHKPKPLCSACMVEACGNPDGPHGLTHKCGKQAPTPEPAKVTGREDLLTEETEEGVNALVASIHHFACPYVSPLLLDKLRRMALRSLAPTPGDRVREVLQKLEDGDYDEGGGGYYAQLGDAKWVMQQVASDLKAALAAEEGK